MSQDLQGVLGVSRTADAGEIRKQQLKLSRQQHPDKVSTEEKEVSEEKFKQIAHAQEVLSDEQKRSQYDQTGQIPGETPEGVPGGGGPGGPGFQFDMRDLFGMFGGRGGPKPNQGRRPGKAPARKTQIALTLKDFYFGCSKTMKLHRLRFCEDCKGEGALNTKSCNDCGGRGMKMNVIQMGPMMMQNIGPCGSCRGSGKTSGDACKPCGGSKFIKQDKDLELNIQKGMRPGDNIVFSGESSHVDEWSEPGDVVVELVAADEDHEWERVGDNLKIRVNLNLGESLCGKKIRVEGHPTSDEGLWIEIPAGVQNRQEICVEGLGMPRAGGKGFGDAILVLSVLPTKEERDILQKNVTIFREMFGISGLAEDPPLLWKATPLQQ